MSTTPAELLRELDAKATKGPWGAGLVARDQTWPGLFQVEPFASFTFGWDGEEGIYCDNADDPHSIVTLRNALPLLAAYAEAADASNEALVRVLGGRSRPSFSGKKIPNEARAMAYVSAYDAARDALVRAMQEGK